VVSFASTDPINGLAANELNLVYDGTPVQVWVDLISSVPAPTASALSISGFLRDEPTSVPEPGFWGLALSVLVTGLLIVCASPTGFRGRSGRGGRLSMTSVPITPVSKTSGRRRTGG
jgi:hypothetical protein